MHIIQIGYERKFLESDSGESARLSRMFTGDFRTTSVILSSGVERMREFSNGRVYSFSGSAFVRMVKAFWKIRSEVRDARSEGRSVIISAQDPFATGFLACVVSRIEDIPYEIQEHGDAFSGYWEKESIVNRIQGWLAGFLLKRADKVRVVSERVKRRLMVRFGVPEEKIYVRQVDQDISWHLQRESRGWSEAPVIVVPCRFVEQKGLFVLLEAAAMLRDRSVAFRLRLVGSGPLEAKLRQRISVLNLEDRVMIESWASQESIWEDSDLFVLSSYYEGWGRTIVEAMAARVPIVTTDTGCVGSLMRPQIDGRVVSVGDAEALANAIAEQILEKERREWMRDQAYACAKEYASRQHEANERQKEVWRSEIIDRRSGLINQSTNQPINRLAWKWTLLLVSSAVALRTLSVALFWKSLGANREWGFFTLVQHWFMGYGYSYVADLGCASAYRSPGFLFILTAIYGVFGFANFLAQAIIQNIAAVILVYAVYRLALELFGDRRIGWIAGAIAMLHPYTFYHYTQYYHTVFSALFLVLALYFLLKLERTKQLRWAVGSGLLVGALAYIQGTILPAMPFIALWLLICWRKEWKKAIGAIAVIALVSAGSIIPWTIRNWRVFHALVPLTTDLGHGFAKANNDHIYYYNVLGYPQEAYEETPITDDGLSVTYALLPEVEQDMRAHGYDVPRGFFMNGIHPIEPPYRRTCEEQAQMNEVTFDKYWKQKAMSWIKENYAEIGWKIELQKIGQFWSPILQPTKRYGAAWSFGNEGVLAQLVKLSLFLYVAFIEMAALAGLFFITRRKEIGRIVPILILFAVYTFMHSWFAGYTKYRIPLDSFLAIFASVSIISVFDLLMKKKKNRIKL